METDKFAMLPEVDIIPLTGNSVSKTNVAIGMYTALTNDPGIIQDYVIYKDGLELLTQGPPGSGMDLEVNQPGATQIVIKANKLINNLVITYNPPAGSAAVIDTTVAASVDGMSYRSCTSAQIVKFSVPVRIASIDYFHCYNYGVTASIKAGILTRSNALIAATPAVICTFNQWRRMTFATPVELQANVEYLLGFSGPNVGVQVLSSTYSINNGAVITTITGMLWNYGDFGVALGYNNPRYRFKMKLNLV